LDAEHLQGADLDAVELDPPGPDVAASGAGDHGPALYPVVDAQAPRLALVHRHAGGAGIDQELHRMALDRAGDPVVVADALADAHLGLLRPAAAGLVVLARQAVAALHAAHLEHRALAV